VIPKDRPTHTDYRAVICNGCKTSTNVHPSQTPAEARTTLASYGWSHVTSSQRTEDYCPRCTAQRSLKAGI
jgi:hypothetical protein